MKPHYIIVYPCDAGFAITKYGCGKLTSQPVFAKDWSRRDMQRALRELYPEARIEFRELPHEIVVEQHFGHAWQSLRPILKGA